MTDTRTYSVTGMDCTSCAQKLENGLSSMDSVETVSVNIMTNRIAIQGDATLDDLRVRVQSLGEYDLLPESAPEQHNLPDGASGFVVYLLRERETQFALSGAAVTLLAVLAAALGTPEAIVNYGYIVGVAIAAYPIARSGLKTLITARTFNLNMLMTIAAVGAVIIGEMVEATVVVFLFAIGEALEGYTTDRARQSIRALAELAPPTANRVNGDLTETVPVEDLRIGDTILVKPGERIQMDGEVMAGSSAVNQAPITGESMPVRKSPAEDAQVFAGSINGDGALTVQVTQLAADNTLSRIIKLVEEAQSVRAPSQRRIDRFSAYYTPAMVVLAAMVATIPPLFFGAPFFEPASGGHGWLYRALVLLVISCPCALVISTPVTVVSAITRAARSGVLIKGGLHLEALAQVKAIAFDKTGTLTQGKPTVTYTKTLNCNGVDNCPDCDDMLELAAAVEQHSTHPLARAVISAAPQRTLTAANVTSMNGRGVQGDVNGYRVTIGSHRLFDEQFPHTDDLCAEVAAHENAGKTAMLVARDTEVLGMLTVADTPRDESADVIARLNAQGLTTIMLTGDNPAAAQAIADQVGVTDVRAGLLPQDKSQAVAELLEKYGSVAMVGDGVNDTPALAAATVGIAMGGAGSAQAIETADITLMADDLRQLPFTIGIARFAHRLIGQNIALSVGVKALFAVLAIAGFTSLWLAIIADVGMLVIVSLNGMRPMRIE